MKQLLISAPVLAFPNFARSFILETDTSGVGLGAILVQSHEDGTICPIAYASRTLQQHEKSYAITELEALARYHVGNKTLPPISLWTSL